MRNYFGILLLFVVIQCNYSGVALKLSSHQDIANSFTSCIKSGISYLPKETQIEMIDKLIMERENHQQQRRLEDDDEATIFYVQLNSDVPAYDFIDKIISYDPQIDYEIIGGEFHSLLVYVTEDILQQVASKKDMVKTYFRFPPISKITIEMMNKLSNPDPTENIAIIEAKFMNSINREMIINDIRTLIHLKQVHSSEMEINDVLPVLERLVHYIDVTESYKGTEVCTSQNDNINITVSNGIILVSVPSEYAILTTAYLTTRPNIIRIDTRPKYFILPPISVDFSTDETPRRLRDMKVQEVMSSRQDVQSFYSHNIHGENMQVGLSDTGVDTKSCFFYDSSHDVRYDSSVAATGHRKINIYVPYCNNKEDDKNGHGTHVAGTLVGETEDESMNKYDGIAYKAQLDFLDIGSGTNDDAVLQMPRTISDVVDTLYKVGSKVHSASWGSASNSYSYDTQSIDNYVYNHPDCLVVYAAGNDGEKGAQSIYSPANGKNVLAVGAVYNNVKYRDLRASFSCQGPTSDGRIKPDIMAPGVSIDSAASSGGDKETCSITTKSGTSMATPIVAGTAVLLSQYLREGYYPSGTANATDGFEPKAATLKAMIIHSGVSLRGEGSVIMPTLYTSKLPDNKQGFGRMEINNVLYWRNESNFNLFLYEGTLTQTNTRNTFNITINISYYYLL